MGRQERELVVNIGVWEKVKYYDQGKAEQGGGSICRNLFGVDLRGAENKRKRERIERPMPHRKGPAGMTNNLYGHMTMETARRKNT